MARESVRAPPNTTRGELGAARLRAPPQHVADPTPDLGNASEGTASRLRRATSFAGRRAFRFFGCRGRLSRSAEDSVGRKVAKYEARYEIQRAFPQRSQGIRECRGQSVGWDGTRGRDGRCARGGALVVGSPRADHRRLGFGRGRRHPGGPQDVRRAGRLRSLGDHRDHGAEYAGRARRRGAFAGHRRGADRRGDGRHRRGCREDGHAGEPGDPGGGGGTRAQVEAARWWWTR